MGKRKRMHLLASEVVQRQSSLRRPPLGQFGSARGRRHARERARGAAGAVLRRMRNAAVTIVALLFLLVVISAATGGLGLAWLAAIPAVFLAGLLVLLWPARRRPPTMNPVMDGGQMVRLDRLAGGAEAWLLDRAHQLPALAAPALDRIVDRLRDLEPSLATVPAESAVGGEAQRLVGQHLPGLVGRYLDLPASERRFDDPSGRELADSLVIVADELDALCDRIRSERRTGFDTERRFIEARYGDPDRLNLDKPA